MKPPLTDEIHILLLEWLAATQLTADYLRGAAASIRAGRSESMLWDAAAFRFSHHSEALKHQLEEMGHDFTGKPDKEWPALIE